MQSETAWLQTLAFTWYVKTNVCNYLPTSEVMSGVTGVGDGDLATGLCSKLSASCCLAFCRHATVTLGLQAWCLMPRQCKSLTSTA